MPLDSTTAPPEFFTTEDVRVDAGPPPPKPPRTGYGREPRPRRHRDTIWTPHNHMTGPDHPHYAEYLHMVRGW